MKSERIDPCQYCAARGARPTSQPVDPRLTTRVASRGGSSAAVPYLSDLHRSSPHRRKVSPPFFYFPPSGFCLRGQTSAEQAQCCKI